jgi:hypothetical protein
LLSNRQYIDIISVILLYIVFAVKMKRESFFNKKSGLNQRVLGKRGFFTLTFHFEMLKFHYEM